MANTSLLTLDNPVYSAFACYTCCLVLKILFMGLLTSIKRVSKGIFVSAEDYAAFGGPKVKAGDDKLKPRIDEGIERVRRNHLNDLENILPYLIIGFIYVTIGPEVSTAIWHFRIFTIARFGHTFVYQLAIPQPGRVFFHTVSLGVIISMIVQIFKVVH